jgi:eukaryotic-like serine/threonine-protein kinase
MKRAEDQPSLPVSVPGLETTDVDSSPGRPAAAETGEFTAEESTGRATAQEAGVDSNATVGPAPGGPTPDATRSPEPVDATTDLGPDATNDFDPGATADHDPDATTGRDRDATGDYDPDATDGFLHSPGVAAANTEEASQSAGGRKGDELPRITGYQVLGVLGAGGMGIVYKARQLRLDRVVALKMIKAGAGARPGDLARFEAEARAVAAIDHPNIIKIFEIGERDGLPYFSLEFLDGGSLAQRIAGKPQPIEDAARIAETLARAMDVAHRRGIVHRDIKPANVLLAADGTPKIADFGLVKRLEADSTQTGTGSILGSPSYMAPEQATGAEKAGPAADQYALGATLYEMLTGRPPFRGPSILDTLDLVRTAEPVAPSQLLPRMPRDLETICLKTLQKDPARRYPDVAAMAEDLRRFRASEPIVARPISGPERAWRWCLRNPKVASLAAAVAVLVVFGLIGATAAAVVIAGKNRELNGFNINLIAANETAEKRRIEAQNAQKRAEEENRRAVAAGRAAIQQNRDVVEAQREMIFKLEDKWRNTPALQEVRRDVLGLATRILESAASSMTALRSEIGWPADDEELNWRSVGLAHQRIGEVRMADNQLAEADKEFRINNEICERVAAANPENLEYQNRLVRSCRQLGVFAQHSMADSREAMRLYQRSLEIARKCVAKEPDNDEFKADLAETLGLMARVELASGHIERARAILDEDRAARESCSAAWKAALRHRRDLAVLYDRLFDVCLRQGDPAAARGYNERSAELTESILAERPQNFGILYNLVRARNNSGMLLYPMGHDPAGAREYHRKALALMNRWLEAEPANAEALQRLATTLYYEATCALKSGDRAGAAAGYRRCLEIREKLATDPTAKMPRIAMMVALARCGQHARAAAIARDLVARPPENEMVYFEAACGFALSAGALRDQGRPTILTAGGPPLAAAIDALIRDDTNRAIDCLRKAKARGYSDVIGLETDPDLEPIQDDPAFRALIAEFPRPAAPKP